jgi:hypothetical protein
VDKARVAKPKRLRRLVEPELIVVFMN